MSRRVDAPIPQGLALCYPHRSAKECCWRCARRRSGAGKEPERRKVPIIDATTLVIGSNNCPMWAPLKGLQ